MSLASVLMGFGLLLACFYFIGQPWRRRFAADLEAVPAPHSSRVQALETKRDATYAALTELEADHHVGKVTDDDYQAVHGQLLAEAVQALQQLDAVADEVDQAAVSTVTRRERSAGTRLASSVAGSGMRDCPECGKRLAADASFCTGCGTALRLSCLACGRTVRSTDRFCGRCGAALVSSASA